MKILAFDLAPSGKTGWATRSGEILSGVLDLSLREDEAPGARWPRVRRALSDKITEHLPDLVVWERVAGNFRSASAYDLYPLQASLVEALHWLGIEGRTVVNSTLKKFATGRGNCATAETFAAAKAKWPGYAFASADEAVARWALLWAENEISAAQASGKAP